MFNLDSITDAIGEIGGLVEGLADPIVSGVKAVQAVKTMVAGPTTVAAAPSAAQQAAMYGVYQAAAPAAATTVQAMPASYGGGYVSPTGMATPVQTYGSPTEPLTSIPGEVGGGTYLPMANGQVTTTTAVSSGLNELMRPFALTLGGARAKAFVTPHPVSGRAVWFRPAGRPVLFSGDLTACKRVKRVAKRARRAGGR